MSVRFDHELDLVSETVVSDSLKSQRTVESRKTVLCSVKSIGRNEFYGAYATGLKPEIIFVLHYFEYNGERKVVFTGTKYRVIRTFTSDFKLVELTCERDVHG